MLVYAFRNTNMKKYTTACLVYDIQTRHLLNIMKCANYCTVTFIAYLHLALLHHLHVLYTLCHGGEILEWPHLFHFISSLQDHDNYRTPSNTSHAKRLQNSGNAALVTFMHSVLYDSSNTVNRTVRSTA
jgi:hypothetical protein